MARLLEKQWRARIWMKEHSPYSWLWNQHIKLKYAKMARQQRTLPATLQFKTSK
jgi:hypothetical protein